MALVSEIVKSCGVKIKVSVGGVPSFGSGVVYVTPDIYDYNYILTAKHIFQEDSQTSYDESLIFNYEVLYSNGKKLERLEYVKDEDVKDKLIDFEEDIIMIIVKKNNDVPFNQILVSDKLADNDLDFFSWGIFTANQDQITRFNFKRNDPENKRFELLSKITEPYLGGMSGAGLFKDRNSELYGIISRYPNENFQGATIDCAFTVFSKINKKLRLLGKAELETKLSKNRREINNRVVDIRQAYINNVCVNLESARKKLETDIIDDWYYDPLKYIDLLSQDYLFEQFRSNFYRNNYKPKNAESFYVPKKKLTLRQALVSPFIDRIMYMATVDVLAEKMNEALISNVFSARYNKYSKSQLIINGVEQWKKMKYKLSECANSRDDEGNYLYGCVLEIDLLNFYDNINKNLLYKKIDRVCETENEKRAAKLLSEIINNISNKEQGLPQNSDASALLATFYLNQVDVFMKHTSHAYFRFMDDIRIFCKDKYEGRKILQTFEYEIRRCHLSVNSQKTKVLTLVENPTESPDEKYRSEYDKVYNYELNKIVRLRKSKNYTGRNEAFHLSKQLLGENLSSEDLNDKEDSAKLLNFALGTITNLGYGKINNATGDDSFIELMQEAVDYLRERPWITTQVCKVLGLISSKVFNNFFPKKLKEIVLEEKYNTYAFQTYQIWLLLAKHKYVSKELQEFAIKEIEKNDETNRPVIASMVIYLCAVDKNYRRVILRKLEEGFTHGYFQDRISLISVRNFESKLVSEKYIDASLKRSHKFTHTFRDKDLVFINGFLEEGEEMDYLEQLYSI
ncbi:hypothetical protein EZY14_007160 [Kordia sp. TARA_039_SRF]|nr:hypothetical protein EZY14_007160 [Kordia sp. TARA_039_SRF]